MELRIMYRDGSTRFINLSEVFFQDSEANIEDKVKKLAMDTGIPYCTQLYNGSELVLSNTIERNKPAGPVSEENSKTRKRYKHAAKLCKSRLINREFTVLSRPSTKEEIDLVGYRYGRRQSVRNLRKQRLLTA